MKPPVVRYHRPSTVDEAVALLADAGTDGKVLAGGQSLVPLLNMRLASPGVLVDVNRLASLAYVRADPDCVRIGALARHADTLGQPAIPLLAEATACVAHAAIRNRGTTVGSIVHADPAAEMPAVLSLLSGSVVLTALGKSRTVPAAEFFLGALASAVEPGELATEAVFPLPPARTGTAWLELSRRHGDYALCGVGVLVTIDDDRRVTLLRAAYSGIGDTPVVLDLTPAAAGAGHDAVDWAAVGALASAGVEPGDDIHATAAYRRHLVGVLTARAGKLAVSRAA
jgi:carbon-monoxide dehydrogenase medium subunit